MASLDLLGLAEQAWNGELDLAFEHHPVHRAYEGSCELAGDLLALESLAGIYVIDTLDGLVMLDAGLQLDVDRTFEAVRAWRPDTPLVAAVFSHHHVDHIFATRRFEEEAAERGWPKPIVYAHRLTPLHFDRYRKTLGWNTAINRRQFAIDAPNFSWPTDYRYPDVTYDGNLTLRRGALTFELHHARGETDDHTWVFVPERALLVPGDLFIWAVPNGGNPQKVQRYVSDWADALDEMAATGAELMLPGHGFPIVGNARVVKALADTAALLRSIEGQTLALMNEGHSLNHILHQVSLPDPADSPPYLQPVYDAPEFLIRMVWRRYGGWWDGEFDTLVPAPKSELGSEWIELAGGVAKVLERSLQLVDEGRFALACHLVESARYAEPGDPEVHRVRTLVLRAHSQQQTSSMARNILNHGALASEQGLRDLASGS